MKQCIRIGRIDGKESQWTLSFWGNKCDHLRSLSDTRQCMVRMRSTATRLRSALQSRSQNRASDTPTEKTEGNCHITQGKKNLFALFDARQCLVRRRSTVRSCQCVLFIRTVISKHLYSTKRESVTRNATRSQVIVYCQQAYEYAKPKTV